MFMDMTILDECRYLYDWMPRPRWYLRVFQHRAPTGL